jgi:hypothetical protein
MKQSGATAATARKRDLHSNGVGNSTSVASKKDHERGWLPS